MHAVDPACDGRCAQASLAFRFLHHRIAERANAVDVDLHHIAGRQAQFASWHDARAGQ